MTSTSCPWRGHDPSILGGDDYFSRRLSYNELHLLRQQLAKSKHTNHVLQMELANAQHIVNQPSFLREQGDQAPGRTEEEGRRGGGTHR